MTDAVHSAADPFLPAADTGREHGAYARLLCRHHAAALLTMAAMVLDDIETAGDIVASTIAAACRARNPQLSADQATRVRLARSVYHRCLGHQAFVERFPQLKRTQHRTRTSPVDHLSADQRAILALVVFGGHDIPQAAKLLHKPTPTVLAELSRMLLGDHRSPRPPAGPTHNH